MSLISTPTRTTEKLEGPRVRQFSVFLENRVGALLSVVKLLNEQAVEVVALSVQDSTDSSIARLIVSDPERVTALFHEHDIPFGSTEVVVVELGDGANDLGRLLATMLMAEVNIFFIYPLLTRPNGYPALVVNVEDHECSSSVMMSSGFTLLSQSDISR